MNPQKVWRPNLANICVRKQIDAMHLCIQSLPFSADVRMECRFSDIPYATSLLARERD
jgi:hypothetical protein